MGEGYLYNMITKFNEHYSVFMGPGKVGKVFISGADKRRVGVSLQRYNKTVPIYFEECVLPETPKLIEWLYYIKLKELNEKHTNY